MNQSLDVSTIVDALDELGAWMRRNAHLALSSSSYAALMTLASDGPLRVSTLAERESLTQPGTTMLINRLEAAGHAERVPDPTDRRATLVRITEAGHEALRERAAQRASRLGDQLRELDPADRDALMRAVPAIRKLIDPSNQ